MVFKRCHKGSAEHGPPKIESPSAAVIAAEQQKITALAIYLGAVASIGGFMFGYVR